MPVSILLSVYNGAAFLPALLRSLQEQSHANWLLIWRDDGSADDSRQIVRHFAESLPQGRCREVTPDQQRLGVAGSFGLLLDHVPDGHCVTFCDQDDVWFRDKLERGVQALGPFLHKGRPALYCSRQLLTDARLAPLGPSPALPENPVFSMALTQNIATGCTIMLSPPAVRLVRAGMPPPAATLHDWWSYLLISGAGGAVITDNRPSLAYRQHQGNTVGAQARLMARAMAAIRRGPDVFMATFRANVGTLLLRTDLVVGGNRVLLLDLERVLDMTGLKGCLARYRLLRTVKTMRRAAFVEQQVFRLWFVLG